MAFADSADDYGEICNSKEHSNAQEQTIMESHPDLLCESAKEHESAVFDGPQTPICQGQLLEKW